MTQMITGYKRVGCNVTFEMKYSTIRGGVLPSPSEFNGLKRGTVDKKPAILGNLLNAIH